MIARWSAALVALVLLSSMASAGVALQPRTMTATLGVLDPPVKLAAGATGVTTLGPNQTSASTIKVATNRADEVLRLQLHAPSAQLVSIRLVGTTGLADINKAVITIGAATQVNIANGVVTQSVGAPVTLGSGGLSVSGNIKLATITVVKPTMTLDIETRPTPTGPLGKERWVVTLS